jgi:polysaccharide deacetylase family protein (PEP-CTERM system associated)
MNLLGIDFEDWFHPELIQRSLKPGKKDPKVINGIDKILDWLRKNDTFATFFVVGELLEYKPEILDKITGNGHEIGFHTMSHTRLSTPGYRESFDEEIKKFAKLTSKKSRGFRAPTFSLDRSTAWAVDILAQNDYVYDSSIVPTKTTMYGVSNAEQKPYRISSAAIDKNSPGGKLIEFPLLISSILGKKIPTAGGFYLRVLPMKIISDSIRNYEKRNIPATFYIHSWELTPEFMPKVPLSLMDSFITYHNLKKTLSKMDQIIKKFKFTSFEKFLANTNL